MHWVSLYSWFSGWCPGKHDYVLGFFTCQNLHMEYINRDMSSAYLADFSTMESKLAHTVRGSQGAVFGVMHVTARTRTHTHTHTSCVRWAYSRPTCHAVHFIRRRHCLEEISYPTNPCENWEASSMEHFLPILNKNAQIEHVFLAMSAHS